MTIEVDSQIRIAYVKLKAKDNEPPRGVWLVEWAAHDGSTHKLFCGNRDSLRDTVFEAAGQVRPPQRASDPPPAEYPAIADEIIEATVPRERA